MSEKTQRWRALAVMLDEEEALLCLGSSITELKNHYFEPWYEHFPEITRRAVHEILVQKWFPTSADGKGEWKTQSNLTIPPVKAA